MALTAEDAEGKTLGPARVRVLFVDDEATVRRALARTLARRGFQVDTAASATEGLQRLKEHRYPVVITDLRMPGVDGNQFIEHARKHDFRSKFLVLTAGTDSEIRMLERHGSYVSAVLRKPWDEDEVVAALQTAIRMAEVHGFDGRQPQSGLLVVERVLLLSPHEADGDKIQADLRAAGSKAVVLRAPRLAEGLDLLTSARFPVVILDLGLPDVAGLDAVRRVQSAAPNAVVIVLSDRDDEAVALQAVRAGAQDYLVKGAFDAAALRRAVNYASERKHFQDRVFRLAHFDQLTGLANRANFRDRLGLALARARRQQGRLAVLVLDVDRFKSVNDSWGHETGDAILGEVARRMKSVFKRDEVVSRLSGDEFAVMIEGDGEPTAVAERVLRAMAEPVSLGAEEFAIPAHIGIATFPGSGHTADDLLRAASGALSAAKGQGRSAIVVHADERETAAMPRLRLLHRLRQGLRNDEYLHHYQPQFRVGDGRLVGFEALLRWQPPGGALESPGRFISVLEESELIIDVGRWGIVQACRDLAALRRASGRELRMSVNLSAVHFDRPELISAVEAALAESALPPAALELEITERILMRDAPLTAKTFQALKAIGCRVAIDDFGVGYSSLAYLRRFAVDALKIDRAFVSTITEGESGGTIASAIIGLGHKLGLEVVAEGVEQEAELDFLRGEGCDVVQGFLTGRPADLDTLGSLDQIEARARRR